MFRNRFFKSISWLLAVQMIIQPALLAFPPQPALAAPTILDSSDNTGQPSAEQPSEPLTATVPLRSNDGLTTNKDNPQLDPQGPNTTTPVPVQTLPLLFIENVGQFGAPGLDKKAPLFELRGYQGVITFHHDSIWIEDGRVASFPDMNEWIKNGKKPIGTAKSVRMRLSFDKANPDVKIVGINPLETKISYLVGEDSSKWRTDVPTYQGIRYVDLYPGVDLEVTGVNGQLVWTVVVKDQNAVSEDSITMKLDGANKIALDPSHKSIRFTHALGDFYLPFTKVKHDKDKGKQVSPKLSGKTIQIPIVETVQPQSGVGMFELGHAMLTASEPNNALGPVESPFSQPLMQVNGEGEYSTRIGDAGIFPPTGATTCLGSKRPFEK